jgi:hypothetical protein
MGMLKTSVASALLAVQEAPAGKNKRSKVGVVGRSSAFAGEYIRSTDLDCTEKGQQQQTGGIRFDGSSTSGQSCRGGGGGPCSFVLDW